MLPIKVITLWTAAWLAFTTPTTPHEAQPTRPDIRLTTVAPGITIDHFDEVGIDGQRFLGADASWTLSTGDLAEAHIILDELGTGEAYFAINGDTIAHVSLADDELAGTTGPSLTSWTPAAIDYPPELVAALMHAEIGELLLGKMVPAEFKCSRFGKKVLKAGKYIWTGLVAAGSTVCCIATEGIGCPVCMGAGAVATLAGQEAADGYCD